MKRWFTPDNLILFALVALLLWLRTWFGIQVNWVEEDYIQIYLIGLEDAFVLDWSYWGPDVFWSRTRIPGAMQGVLAGLPIKLYPSMYSPIVVSNLISGAGLLLFAWYVKKRFPKISKWFIVPYLLLLPFPLYHGSVLLNTAYLIFSGSLLIMAVLDLFLYRDELLIPAHFWCAILGFALLFTFQLHLTWVMFLPYIGVLGIMEWRRSGLGYLAKCALFFVLGSLVSGALLFPTLFTYFDAVFAGVDGNLVFKPERVADILDLFTRMMGYATYDMDPRFMHFKLAAESSTLTLVLLWTMKIFGMLQLAVFLISGYWLWHDARYRKTVLLWGLTILMALGMYVISNKHLSSRTYILVTMLPVWFSFYTLNLLYKFKGVRIASFAFMGLMAVTTFLVGWHNQGEEFSFGYRKEVLQQAIDEQNPYVLGERRKSIMDNLK